jgi:hypothetical protein
MMQRRSKRVGLEIRVRFEPDRLAEESLARAYARLLPLGRRPVPSSQRPGRASAPDVVNSRQEARR